MSDDVVTATEGAEREPVSPEVSEVGQEGQASQPTQQDPDAELWDRVRKLDPSKMPDDVRINFEKPLLSNYTRKYQELAQQQQQFLNSVVGKLQEKGIDPSLQQRTELLDRIKNGEFDAIEQYVDKTISDRVGPYMQTQALKSAIETAGKMHPWVADPAHERDIANAISSDPVLSEMAKAQNFRYAPQVLAGVALQLENQALKAQLQQAAALKTEYEKLKGMQDRAKGLPGTTSRAGTTPSASLVSDGDMELKDAMRAAFIKMGRTPDF